MLKSKMENKENPILKLRQPLIMLAVIRKTVITTLRNRRPLLVILCLVILTNMLVQVASRCDLMPLHKYFPYKHHQFLYILPKRGTVWPVERGQTVSTNLVVYRLSNITPRHSSSRLKSRMENQENPILKRRQPLSMVGIIRETINTIVRNRRPLQVISCLVILTNMQLQVATTRYFLEPLPEDYSVQITYEPISKSVNMRQGVTGAVHEHLLAKFHTLFTSCCLCLYFAIITISCSYESYAGNTVSIMDAFLKPSKNWKRPLLTSGCILLLTLGIYVVYIFSFLVILFFAGSSHVSSIHFYMAALKWIFNAHVGALWMMSLVVTVLEDNISGLKAINRAGDLMKGSKIQITLLMVLYYGARLLVRKMFNAFSLIYEEWGFEEIGSLKIPFFSTGFDVLLFVLCTVLYHECKTDKKVDGSSDPTYTLPDKYS